MVLTERTKVGMIPQIYKLRDRPVEPFKVIGHEHPPGSALEKFDIAMTPYFADNGVLHSNE